MRLWVLLLYCCFSSHCVAAWFFISVTGNDNSDGLSPANSFATFEHAIPLLEPGDTLYILPGVYQQAINTVKPGKPGYPIRITGPDIALVRGGKDYRVATIQHSYVELSGFTLDSRRGDGLQQKDYRDKLLEISSGANDTISGIKIRNMTLRNAFGECLRVKNSVIHTEISGNDISYCGLRDSRFGRGKDNAEAIYIGTAPEQLQKNSKDLTAHIWIHNNRILSQISECIDVKEGVRFSRVERNFCQNAWQVNSGGINVRGSDNQIINNVVVGGKGVGIRIGGDTPKNALNNVIANNQLIKNQQGALKLMNWPQSVCGNFMQSVAKQKLLRMNGDYPVNAEQACND